MCFAFTVLSDDVLLLSKMNVPPLSVTIARCCIVMSLCQNIRDLTPLTHDVISRQATINIGLSFSLMAYVCNVHKCTFVVYYLFICGIIYFVINYLFIINLICEQPVMKPASYFYLTDSVDWVGCFLYIYMTVAFVARNNWSCSTWKVNIG